MTDGIIQEVFRNFMDKNNYDIRDMVIHFPELQQELIEKIKQEYEMLQDDYNWDKFVRLRKLIGDNQE